jgi:hypothetical protein
VAGRRRKGRHELTATQCREVLGELLAYSSGETLVIHTAEGWIQSWVEGKRGSERSGWLLGNGDDASNSQQANKDVDA